ncbi:MAG TPA: ABC transporter ATP-binding protein [Crinalium sp.]
MTMQIIAEHSVDASPVVKVTDCWKIYKLGSEIVRALKGVSVTLKHGEFVCLMGPSGSGKTTLLHLIAGLDRITKGDIAIDGISLTRLPENQLSALRHDKIGFIFQSYNLIPVLSAVENVELPLLFSAANPKKLRQRAIQLLQKVGLGDRLYHKPSQLSGGQQQRVSIARSLISNPSIIVADEPTANLDQKTGKEILELLCELNSNFGVTILVSTHDPNVAECGTRVIHLADGQIMREEIRRTVARENAVA